MMRSSFQHWKPGPQTPIRAMEAEPGPVGRDCLAAFARMSEALWEGYGDSVLAEAVWASRE